MSKLILETQISIDGYIADVNDGTDWMIWNWGPDWTWDKDLQTYHTNLNKSANNILISSQMALEGFNEHWKQVTLNSSDPRFKFASHIVNTNKYVITRTLTKEIQIPGGWKGIEILKGNMETEIKKLKNKNNGDIIVYGGASLVSSLIDANLIDEYHFIINPVALGKGLPIFKTKKNLKMVDTRLFDCGIVINQYRKK